MRGIAKFYTWFWVIYFPVCIAFQKVVNFDFSDELLMILLVFYTIVKSRYIVKKGRKLREMFTCYAILLFYLLYSFVVSITTLRGIMLDFLQQIRPYSVFYLTWLLAPRFTRKQKRLIVAVMLSSLLVYIAILLVSPDTVAYFGNKRGNDFTLGQLSLCCGMIYYLFSKHTKQNRYISLGIILLGLMGGKSKYIGECIAFIGLVLFIKKKIQFDSAKFVAQLTVMTAVIIFFTWTKFNLYYVEGIQNEETSYARPMSYKVAFRIITQDYIPFGTGYGTFSVIAAAKEYSPIYYKYDLDKVWGLQPENPMFLADAFYPSLAEYGILGVIFFFLFWKKRIQETHQIVDVYSYRMGLMAIIALLLESVADTSYLSGKGMGYFMIMAICLNANRTMAIRKQKLVQAKTMKRKVITHEENKGLVVET